PIDIERYVFRERSLAHPTLVWLRAFADVYQPQTAIRVLKLIHKKYPDAKLLLIGPDTNDGTFRACSSLIEDLELRDSVTVSGQIKKYDVPQMLAPHDIFLNTTRAESFGVSVMEAAALGLCIVTTNVGELPYIWMNEENAMLVP